MGQSHPLHPALMTLDLHIDAPWKALKYGPLVFGGPLPKRDVDFPRMKQGGLHAAFFALYLPDAWQDTISPHTASLLINQQIEALNTSSGCQIVTRARDAHLWYTEQQIVPIFLGLEGGRLLNNTLDRLRELHAKGVRYLTLTHNRNTGWADSATDAPRHGGLDPFGHCVLRECEKLGVFVDVSHASDQTCIDVTSLSRKPVLATHSGCRVLLDHPRNLSDVLIKAIAKTGGLIGVPFVRRFVGPKASSVIDHIDHIVQQVGVSHVGIGSDLDGAAMVDDVRDVSDWSHIVIDGLSDRGYADANIAAIAGGNMMRLLA